MTEYLLQKRTLSMWSYVTTYYDLAQAKANFNKVRENSGYSWRIVELKVIEEKLNEGETDLEETPEPSELPTDEIKPSWGSPAASDWRKSACEASIKSEHGMVGKVWLGNPSTKEKKRVEPSMVAGMLADGWIKTGPRTVL